MHSEKEDMREFDTILNALLNMMPNAQKELNEKYPVVVESEEDE